MGDSRKSASERGYDSRWQKARDTYLKSHPLCVMCHADGELTPAKVVDHVIPHRGDQKLFWDTANWQALCKRCHDSDKQRLEKSGEKRTKFTPDGRVIWN
ncbi:MAG: HNH endonuclease [Phenylobacterium zucineum]|nr:MAG: HNH endonuclease [Phenylobacterium zucineum]